MVPQECEEQKTLQGHEPWREDRSRLRACREGTGSDGAELFVIVQSCEVLLLPLVEVAGEGGDKQRIAYRTGIQNLARMYRGTIGTKY